MLVDFNTLPEESRVWIYQANRSFTDEEITEIEHVTSASKGEFYDVEFKQKGKNMDVEFRANGEIIN